MRESVLVALHDHQQAMLGVCDEKSVAYRSFAYSHALRSAWVGSNLLIVGWELVASRGFLYSLESSMKF